MKKVASIKIFAVMISAGLILFCAGTACAFPMFGDGVLGDFTGEFTYNASNSTSAALTVKLTNTSLAANGGYLTAFAFNNPNNLISAVALMSTDPDFELLGGPVFDNNVISASPYGNFDIGASISKAFQGGGNPQRGIGVGSTETFTYLFTGNNLNTLNDWSFANELSEGTGAGESHVFFIARYRGFEDGGSNKTPGVPTPEPATVSLLGLGLAGLLGFRKKSSKKLISGSIVNGR